MAAGSRMAPTSGTAGAGQKNSEMTKVTAASTQKATLPPVMTLRNGWTIRLSLPSRCSAPSIAVIRAMIRKMLNSSPAATSEALNIDPSPSMTLPV